MCNVLGYVLVKQAINHHNNNHYLLYVILFLTCIEILFSLSLLDKSDPIEKSKVVVQFPSAERFKPSYVHRCVTPASHTHSDRRL